MPRLFGIFRHTQWITYPQDIHFYFHICNFEVIIIMFFGKLKQTCLNTVFFCQFLPQSHKGLLFLNWKDFIK